MKISYIGKFIRLHDEEYIARSFEALGHQVIRIPQSSSHQDIVNILKVHTPDILLYAKWNCPPEVKPTIVQLQRAGMKTVCWLFDLYFGYHREYIIRNSQFFKSDFVFTTDGGHNPQFTQCGIKHHCVRQGIYKDECVMFDEVDKSGIVFVGSSNPLYPERQEIMAMLKDVYGDHFTWYGRKDTNEIRGMDLNKLYAKTKIVIGDAVFSPHYWSNRVVETLGRGGFMIHPEVPGIAQEYPYLVLYRRGDMGDLRKKIDYYLTHNKEREEIRRKNFEFVRDRYTTEKKCLELLQWLNQ